LASLAVLIGHADRAAALLRLDTSVDPMSPAFVPPAPRALLAFASAGGPVDSIKKLEVEISNTILSVDAARRQDATRQWLVRPIALAFPVYQSRLIADLGATGDVLAEMDAAWARRDTAHVRQRLQALRDGRRSLTAEALKLEAVYPEAWLLADSGNPRAGLDWLAPTLDAQSRASAKTLSDVVGAGVLIRAMALRATLASAAHDDASAAQWARAVTTLWADADPFLQQTVVRPMARLAK